MFLLSLAAVCSLGTLGRAVSNGDWGQWGSRSAAYCYGSEPGCYYTETRLCNKPGPTGGGLECLAGSGVRTSSEDRNNLECNEGVECAPVNGGWVDWSTWSACSTTCGEGHRTRYRTCTDPNSRDGGQKCLLSTLSRADTVYRADEEMVSDPCMEMKCPGADTVYEARNTSIVFLVLFLVFFVIFLILLCALLCRDNYKM